MRTRHAGLDPESDDRAVSRLRAVPIVALLVMLSPALSPGLEAQANGDRVNGAQVRVVNTGGTDVSGELLGLKHESIWVLDRERGEHSFLSLPLADLREVRMQRHSWSGDRIALWTALAGGTTTVAMYGACSSLDDDPGTCGVVTLAWAGAWVGIGLITRLLIGPSWLRFRPATVDRLRPYARFPQGLPDGYPPRADDRVPQVRPDDATVPRPMK